MIIKWCQKASLEEVIGNCAAWNRMHGNDKDEGQENQSKHANYALLAS